MNAILSSHKRRELFRSIQQEISDGDPLWRFGSLHLIQDGGIRWHSVYRMLLHCHELKDAVLGFIRRWSTPTNDEVRKQDQDQSYDPMADAITDADWDDVKQLADFLEPFYQITET